MKRLGLALGSGAARGWSHIGVLDALSKHGIEADVVAGTSMGAIVGGVYAANRLDMLRDTALTLDLKDLIKLALQVTMPRSGLLNGKRIVDLMRTHLEAQSIEELPKPFACVACHLTEGVPEVFRSGNLIDAIRASISIPGVFTPVYAGGKVLVDGGVVNPVPVDVARALGADVVVAVDVNHGVLQREHKPIPTNYVSEAQAFSAKKLQRREGGLTEKFREHIDRLTPDHFGVLKEWLAPDPVPNIVEVIVDSVVIMEKEITERNLMIHPADILIQPQVGELKGMDFHRAEEAIEAGYVATLGHIDAIKHSLED